MEYDKDGFDQDGFNEKGLNRDGYNRDGMKKVTYNTMPKHMFRKYDYSWIRFGEHMNKIFKSLSTDNYYSFDCIYPLSAGGLIMAAAIAKKYDVPVINDKSKINETTLIVDDATKGGSTIRTIRRSFGKRKCMTIVLVGKDISRYDEGKFCEKVDMRDWVIFPWTPEGAFERFVNEE